MKIKTETIGSASVVHFAGAADVSAVEEIRRALGECMGACGSRVVCDLSETDFICSDALGAFISAYEGAREAGGFVRLVHPQARIADILATTQLNRLFTIYDNVDAALKD